MEIAPVAGIRVMPVRKVQPAEPSLSGVFDINLFRAHDDTYSGSGKGTGGQDGQTEEQDELLSDDTPHNKPYISERVSFFA